MGAKPVEKKKPPKYWINFHSTNKASKIPLAILDRKKAAGVVMPTVSYAEMLEECLLAGLNKQVPSLTFWALLKVGKLRRVARGMYTYGE